MDNAETIQVALRVLAASLKRAREKILKLEEPQKRLSFEEVQKKKQLYDELGKATDRLNANQRTLSHLILTKEQLRQLKRTVRQDTAIPLSLRNSYLAQIEDHEKHLQDLIDASEALVKGLEQMTRYYNGFSYLASSHYLN